MIPHLPGVEEGSGLKRILFLCTGNSARSIIAESVMNQLGNGAYRAFSAGSRPNGWVHPITVEVLAQNGYAVDGLRSKSWDEFSGSGPDRAALDIVITVCDNAAKEACPVWPGSPLSGHWSVPDPVAVDGDGPAIRAIFAGTLQMLEGRIGRFVDLTATASGPGDLSSALRSC